MGLKKAVRKSVPFWQELKPAVRDEWEDWVRAQRELDRQFYSGIASFPERKLSTDELLEAVLDSIWRRQGLTDPSGHLKKGNDELKRLIARAREVSEKGKAALVSNEFLMYTAFRGPSMGGEIEEIRSTTRWLLSYYVKRHGRRLRRGRSLKRPSRKAGPAPTGE